MRTDSEIKALAEEKAKRFINGIEFNKWNNMEPFFRQTIISAMCEMYKAALSGTERVECYLPCEFSEGEVFVSTEAGALPLKLVTLTVVNPSKS